MNTPNSRLRELIEINRSLLREITREEPSPETLRQLSEERRGCLHRLEQPDRPFSAEAAAENRKFLISLFEEFDAVHDRLQAALHGALEGRGKNLSDATRGRQAVKSYGKVSEKPDITHF